MGQVAGGGRSGLPKLLIHSACCGASQPKFRPKRSRRRMIAVQVGAITIQQSLYRNPCGEVVAAPPHGRKKRYLTPLIITRALASCHGNLSDHLSRNQVSALWVYTRFGPNILAEHVGRTCWPKSSSLPVLPWKPLLPAEAATLSKDSCCATTFRSSFSHLCCQSWASFNRVVLESWMATNGRVSLSFRS